MTNTMQLSPVSLSAPARTAVAAMVKTGAPAIVQYERGERKAYFRDLRGKEKPVDPMAVDELVKAGIVADRQDGLFQGIGQTYEPRQHAVLKIRLGGTRTDKATGARFRKAEVETTAGAFQCEVCARASKDADPLDGEGIKAEVRRLIAEKRPVLGSEQ